MSEALVIAELRRLTAVVESLRAELQQVLNPSTLRPVEAAAVDAMGSVFGAGAVTTREVLQATREDFGDRPALRTALEEIAPGLRAQSLGIALGGIAARGGQGSAWRLVRATTEQGSRVWSIGPRGT